MRTPRGRGLRRAELATLACNSFLSEEEKAAHIARLDAYLAVA